MSRKKKGASRARYDFAGSRYSPEQIRFAHKLFVINRLTSPQIAGMMKRTFSAIRTRVDSIARTVLRWTKADPDESGSGYWQREREDLIRREIALQHDGEQLIEDLFAIVKARAKDAKENPSSISANDLAALTRAVSALYKYFAAREQEGDKTIVITGNADFQAFMNAVEDVLGIEWRRVMPQIQSRYSEFKKTHGEVH